jgi:alanyl-tRNA synthetase
VQLVFDRSPFYAESGGQVGDCGWIEYEGGEKIEIVNTVKENGLPVHIATTVPSDPQATFTARIDAARREAVTNNHTATHLLHKALRETLGLHIEQKGSSVTATGFRFDFSHFEKIDPATLRTVEKLVNKYIRENRPRNEFRNMPIEEAKEKGAMALFGEKYGDTVRVIQYGDSIELCGGTHVEATGQIGFFKIVSEGAVAAGIRRIEATTGVHAEELLYTVEDLLGQIKSYFNNTPNVAASIKKLIADNDALKKSAEEFMKERAISLKDALIKNAQEINGYHVLGMKGNFGAELVKNIAFLAKQECTNTIMIAATEHEGKPTLTLMYTDDLVAKGANAGKDIREAAKFIMGGGGGQPGLATAGGKNTAGLDEAYNKLIEIATK